MGVLRWRSLLDEKIAQASSQAIAKLDLEVLTALRLAAYQLRSSDRIPARAAIHQSVELTKHARKKSAAPFVNAVLRKIASASPAPGLAEDSAETLARVYAHPEWLVERWVRTFGIEVARRICAYDQQIPQTTIRLRAPGAEDELRAVSIELRQGEFLRSARRVRVGSAASTAAFREGRVAIQDEASQLVATLVGRGSRILDCCAAPGGKTAILAELNPHAEITAVELHPHRARLLRRLVRAKNVRVVCGDATKLPLSGDFDRVLVDVPCSGTGTLAHNPDIKWRLMPEDLADLRQRQFAILNSAMEQVARGGKLVYSTCSLEAEENAEVVDRALAVRPAFRLIDCHEELGTLADAGEFIGEVSSLTTGPYLRTIPGLHFCEGFFAAILKRS